MKKKGARSLRLEFAKLSHDPYQARHVYSFLALGAVLQGKFAEAKQWLTQAEAALAPLASSEPRAFLHHARGWLAYTRGDYAAAEEHFSLAVELFRELGPGALVWYLAPLGLAQLRQGHRHEAMACMSEVETLLASQQEGAIVVADALSKLALMALLLGDRERVAAYYPRLLPFQGLYFDFLLDRVLGEMETLLGAWSQAHTHLSTAEEMARQGLVPELARTLIAQGKLALAQGGRGSVARARTLFEQAHALFEQLDMQGEAKALREQLEHLPGKSPARHARPLPAGLSEREVEVLRLIVAGKSNRQIADELILSEGTVANHLAHIFNKNSIEAFVLPALASSAAGQTFLDPAGPLFGGPLTVFLLLTGGIFSLGCLLFCIAILRSDISGRWAGLLLLAGILLAFSPPLPQVVGTIGSVLFGLGLIWFGYVLLARSGERAVQAQATA